MFNFNNNHIFTGYLKQLLSSVNIPMCKIYTTAFESHFASTGIEDPRVIESFNMPLDNLSDGVLKEIRVNYLKNDEIYNFVLHKDAFHSGIDRTQGRWYKVSNVHYDKDRAIPGLTKVLKSPGSEYDNDTHEYLGDYLRFIRDYYNINLMSMYNCFNNKPCSNIGNVEVNLDDKKVTTYTNSPMYTVYAIPVKLFSNYTIAIDSNCGIEMFCGLYNGRLDLTDTGKDLIFKTYTKEHKTIFSQPFLYDKLSSTNWNISKEIQYPTDPPEFPTLMSNILTRSALVDRERDLKLFIKVPRSCRSSIVILEGDYRHYNHSIYSPSKDDHTLGKWLYKQNHFITNYNRPAHFTEYGIVPISKLQLLALNTGTSYPFADRLIEYLVGSVITPIDEIADNIKRVQAVLAQNGYKQTIEGFWEDDTQRIIYDYVMTSGPFISDGAGKVIDLQRGYIPSLGHKTKSTLYDVLGYVDKDAEKWYASWQPSSNDTTFDAEVKNSIQNVDIYNGIYDI